MTTKQGDMVRICYDAQKGHPAFVGHKIWHVCRIKDGEIRVYGLPQYQKSWIIVKNAHP